jgi:hypothetical protein
MKTYDCERDIGTMLRIIGLAEMMVKISPFPRANVDGSPCLYCGCEQSLHNGQHFHGCPFAQLFDMFTKEST